MTKATDRTPAPLQVKAEPVVAPSVPATPTEPGDEVVLHVLGLNLRTGVLTPVFSYKMPESQVATVEEKITEVLTELPGAPEKKVGRPPLRVIITKVDKQDPDFLGMGGEPYVVGEVVELSEFIRSIKAYDPSNKVSAQKLRHYFDSERDAEQNGYSVRKFEQFLKRDLFGPAKRDFQVLADAHAEWAKENNITPFE